MPYIEAPGRTLYAESFGSSDDPTLLLVNGLTSQLLSWPIEFCEAFVDRGMHVVRFDNRDVGLSTTFEDAPSYSLSDMADDAAEIIGYYGASPAHIFGISMGGMIVQTLAAERPELVASMTSMASTTGNTEYGRPTTEAIALLLAPPPTTRDEAIAASIVGKRCWGTPDTWNEADWSTFAAQNWDRSHPEGGGERQYEAIVAAGNRDSSVATISVPSLVIHGSADTLIDVSGGRHTAELIEGSLYLEIEDMNHDVPQPMWPQIIEAVLSVVRDGEARLASRDVD